MTWIVVIVSLWGSHQEPLQYRIYGEYQVYQDPTALSQKECETLERKILSEGGFAKCLGIKRGF